jgi:hypothetical protein
VLAGIEVAVCPIDRGRRCDDEAIGKRRVSGELGAKEDVNLLPRVDGNQLNGRKKDGGQMAAGAVAQRS